MSMEIDVPQDDEDYDNIRWYLLHDNVQVWISEEGEWHVEFKTRCSALTQEGLCSIYDGRPMICRSYESEDCEKHGEYWGELLKTPRDLEEYLSRN